MYPLFRFCKDLRKLLSPIIPYLTTFFPRILCIPCRRYDLLLLFYLVYMFLALSTNISHSWLAILASQIFPPGSFSFFLKYVIKNLSKNLFIINSCHFSFVWKFFVLKFWKILPFFHPYSWKYIDLVNVCSFFSFNQSNAYTWIKKSNSTKTHI